MSDDKVVPLFNRNTSNHANPMDFEDDYFDLPPEDFEDQMSEGNGESNSNGANNERVQFEHEGDDLKGIEEDNQDEEGSKHSQKYKKFVALLDEVEMPPGRGVLTSKAYKEREDYLREAKDFRESIVDKLADDVEDDLASRIEENLSIGIESGDALQISMDPRAIYLKLNEPLTKVDEQGNTLYYLPEGILRLPINGDGGLGDLKQAYHYDFDEIPSNLKPMWDEESQSFKNPQQMSRADYMINEAIHGVRSAKEAILRRLNLSPAKPVNDFTGEYDRIFSNKKTESKEKNVDPVIKRLVEKYRNGDIADSMPKFTESASEINKHAAQDMIDGFGVMDRSTKEFEEILLGDPVAGPAYERWTETAFKMDRASQMKASYHAAKIEAIMSSNDELMHRLSKPIENMASASEIISMIQSQPGSDLVIGHLAGMRESLFSQADMQGLHGSSERFAKLFQQVEAESFITKFNGFSEDKLELFKKYLDPDQIKRVSEMVSNVIDGISSQLQDALGFGDNGVQR